MKTADESSENSMTNFERLKLAEKRYRESKEALVGFAEFHLPERIRAHFTGETGREVFMHSVVFGNSVWPKELVPQFDDVVRRAQRFLSAIPRFRKLSELNFDAYMLWADAKHQDELDHEDYASAIEDTYRMIDREMFDDLHDECRELGLVD